MINELCKLALAKQPQNLWPTFDGKELDRSEFLTSSEVGSCMRRSFFGKYQDKYPPKMSYEANGYALRGHAIEAWFAQTIKVLEADGYKFEYMVPDQRSFYDADAGLSGTPDGLMTTPTGEIYLLEIKSIDPRFNKTNLPKRPHVIQVHQNMMLVEHCLKINLAGAILFYIDASNITDIREFPIAKDERVRGIIKERAALLWEAKMPDELEPEGLFNGDCEYCVATHHCSATVNMQKMLDKAGKSAAPFLEKETPDITEELSTEALFNVRQFVDAKEAIKQYTEEKDEVEAGVREIVTSNGGVVVISGTRFSATIVGGRETIDAKLMEADGIDLEPYKKVGAPYVMMRTVSVTGNGKGE